MKKKVSDTIEASSYTGAIMITKKLCICIVLFMCVAIQHPVLALDTNQIIILENLANSWRNRVWVNKEKLHLDQAYDETYPDFPIELLSYKDHDLITSLSDYEKRKLLSATWISYVTKTIDVENAIIKPACQLIIDEAFDIDEPLLAKRLMSQTIVDEQFHILMTLEACTVSRQRYGFQNLHFPEPSVISVAKNLKNNADSQWKKDTISLAFASVAEMAANAFLKLLSEDSSIQPMNRITTQMHKEDEESHSEIFVHIVSSIYKKMNIEQQKYFKTYLNLAMDAFNAPDTGFTKAVLEAAEVKDIEAVIEYSKNAPKNEKMARNYQQFHRFLKMIEE